jgi:hypothetical protein
VWNIDLIQKKQHYEKIGNIKERSGEKKEVKKVNMVGVLSIQE